MKRGALLSVVPPESFTPTQGMVAVDIKPVPPNPGALPVNVKNGKGGVEITKTFIQEVVQLDMQFGFPLKAGDVITQVHGSPTPDLDAWKRVFAEWKPSGKQPRIAGEPVTVKYVRDGKALETTFPLANDHNLPQFIQVPSRRSSGFPKAIVAVFDKSRPEHCGSPVIDSKGQVIGVYIAKSEYLEDLVLPVDEVKASLKLLTKLAAEKKEP